jgi:hypothetical protein
MVIPEVFTMDLNVFVITWYGYLLNNRDNVFSLCVIICGLGDRILFPAGTNIFLFAIACRLALGPPSILFIEYRGIFPHRYRTRNIKLTIYVHIAPKRKYMELCLHSPYSLMALKNFTSNFTDTFLPIRLIRFGYFFLILQKN